MLFVNIFVIAIAACHAQTEFSERARNFSIEFLHFTEMEMQGHVVISPFGVWTLLTGVALGATGKSKYQLQRALLLPPEKTSVINGYRNLTKTVLDPRSEGVTLTCKNYVFLDEGFEIYPDFKRTLKMDFEAQMVRLDFRNSTSAASIANSVIEKSGATVSNVMKSDDFTDSRMILTNVISFKGLWTSPFNESETVVEPFYNEHKKQIGQVKMMQQRSLLAFSNIQEIEANVIELPYGDGKKYSMLVILPYPRVSVNDVYNKFTEVTLDDVIDRMESDNLEFGIEEVDVKLPRFKISTNIVLNKPLNSMGVFDIFSSGKASFENISKEDIFISAIVHKADIEVTESGTVASADTSAIFSDRISTPNFDANRPFIYFIMERPTRTVIFSGIYSKPSIF